MYRLILAQVRYYYKIPFPEKVLSDYEIIKYWQDLQYMRKSEAEGRFLQLSGIK